MLMFLTRMCPGLIRFWPPEAKPTMMIRPSQAVARMIMDAAVLSDEGGGQTGLRAKALAEIKQVRWIPSWGEDRISNMVAYRSDWCISRQRAWGVPIVAFYCAHCGHILADQRLAEQ